MKKLFSPIKLLIYSVSYLFVYELVLMRFDEIIPGVSASLGRIFNTLAAGYIPSYIVYYLVTEIPRKKELDIAKKQISHMKNHIVQDLSSIIAELNLAKDKELQKKVNDLDVDMDSFIPKSLNYSKVNGVLKVPEITKQFIIASSKLIYPQKETFTAEIITNWTEQGTSISIVKMPWLSFVTKMMESTREHIDAILKYTNYLSIEELGELQDIRNSNFASYILNFEKSFQNMQASHRKSWEGDFSEFLWEYYNLIRQLNGQEQIKNE